MFLYGLDLKIKDYLGLDLSVNYSYAISRVRETEITISNYIYRTKCNRNVNTVKKVIYQKR